MSAKFEEFENPSWFEENDESIIEDDLQEEQSDSDWDNNEEDGYEVHWPGDRVARPPVSFLIKYHAPPLRAPQPVEPSCLERYEKYKANLKTLDDKKSGIKKRLDDKCGEIAKAEMTPVTYANKWSDKAKGNGRDALIKRLVAEQEAILKEFDGVTTEIAALEKANKSLSSYIASAEYCKSMYEECIRKQREGWIKMYGPHTPIKSIRQLKLSYEIVSVTPGSEEGMIQIKFADDMKVGHTFRELKLGGHEYICRVHWDTLEVIESAFKE
jgi:hypothetical protein